MFVIVRIWSCFLPAWCDVAPILNYLWLFGLDSTGHFWWWTHPGGTSSTYRWNGEMHFDPEEWSREMYQVVVEVRGGNAEWQTVTTPHLHSSLVAILALRGKRRIMWKSWHSRIPHIFTLSLGRACTWLTTQCCGIKFQPRQSGRSVVGNHTHTLQFCHIFRNKRCPF